MKATAILPVFVILLSVACATDVAANYQNILPARGYHVNTDMRLTSDVTFAVTSGTVISGNAANLQPGDTVCAGATVTSTPTVSAKWAVSGLDVLSIYPEGDMVYTPPMIPGPAVSTNRDIAWLSQAVYDKHDAYGDGTTHIFNWDDAFTKTMYNELATFYNQPVSYRNTTGTYNNKEAGVNVFCKGAFTVQDGGTTRGSSPMPSPQPVSFAITGAGQHTVTAGLGGMSCFAAVVKHPLNQQDYPGFFRLYYFTSNQPAIPAISATDTITLNVQDSGGTCRLTTSAIYVMRAPSSPGTTIVRTTVRNDADAARVYNVTSSNPAFAAAKLTPAVCTALGFPTSLCPASGGFDEQINPGATRDIYAIVTTSATSGGTVLRFDAETVSGACGASSRCNATADLGDIDGGVTCVITPPSLRMEPLERGTYSVACQDLAGANTACAGDNWASTPNLGGAFLSRSSTGATFYSDAPMGTSGTLTYTSDNPGMDIARCNSTLDIVDITDETTMSCEFLPPRADMSFNEQKYFELHCLLNGTIPVTPLRVEYDAINSLQGAISNRSANGATYTAPGFATIGDLFGNATYPVRPNVDGAIALAGINVSREGGTDPYTCNITPGMLDLGTNEYGMFNVQCANRAGIGIPCIDDNWTWVNVSGSFVSGHRDSTHAWAYPTSEFPAAGYLTYVSQQALCNSSITVVPRRFRAEFDPPGARLDLNREKYFNLLAYDLRGPSPVRITPTSVAYALIEGLGGGHANDSTNGTLYQSPDYNTSGRLEGAVALNTGLPNVGGAMAFASITVANGTGNDQPWRPGSSEWCTIFGPGSLYPGYIGWVTIWCGPGANKACSAVVWGGSGAQILASSSAGAFVNVSAAAGTEGYVSAYVDGDSKRSCALPFYSGTRECVDVS